MDGDLNGESRDLFTSAATGLENMFKPPPPVESSVEVDYVNEPERNEYYQHTINDSTMPSSPPPYPRMRSEDQTFDSFPQSEMEESHEEPEQHQPKAMKYRMVDGESADASSFSAISSRDFANVGSAEQSAGSINAPPAYDASRKTSGKSIIRNEGLSPILISRHSSEDGRVSFAPIDLPADQLKKRLEKLRRNQILLEG